MEKHGLSRRALYRQLDEPGRSPVRDAHAALDAAVRAAYGMRKKDDVLTFLLDLNLSVAAAEENGDAVVGPGLPPEVKDRDLFVTEDCVKVRPA
jgi:hypothetical protein